MTSNFDSCPEEGTSREDLLEEIAVKNVHISEEGDGECY